VTPEPGIGNHIDPGRGRGLTQSEDRHIFPPIFREATKSIVEFERLQGRTRCHYRLQCRLPDDPGYLLGFGHAIQLIGEWPALPDQDNPRDRCEQRAGFRRNQIGSQHEDTPMPLLLTDRRPRLASPNLRLQRDLQVLHVRGRPLVQNNEVNGQLLHPPVLMRLQQLAGDVEVFDVGDA
jgi:hypothetical protein